MPLCAECKEAPLRSKAALATGICGACIRSLGAMPVRRADGKHDRRLCRCDLCLDWRSQIEADAYEPPESEDDSEDED